MPGEYLVDADNATSGRDVTSRDAGGHGGDAAGQADAAGTDSTVAPEQGLQACSTSSMPSPIITGE